MNCGRYTCQGPAVTRINDGSYLEQRKSNRIKSAIRLHPIILYGTSQIIPQNLTNFVNDSYTPVHFSAKRMPPSGRWRSCFSCGTLHGWKLTNRGSPDEHWGAEELGPRSGRRKQPGPAPREHLDGDKTFEDVNLEEVYNIDIIIAATRTGSPHKDQSATHCHQPRQDKWMSNKNPEHLTSLLTWNQKSSTTPLIPYPGLHIDQRSAHWIEIPWGLTPRETLWLESKVLQCILLAVAVIRSRGGVGVCRWLYKLRTDCLSLCCQSCRYRYLEMFD